MKGFKDTGIPIVKITKWGLFLSFSLISLALFSSSRDKLSCLQLKATIDGSIDEWASITPLKIMSKDQLVRGNWKGMEDTSALLRLAWNDEELLIALELTDDDFPCGKSRGDLWDGDSLIVEIMLPTFEDEDKRLFFIFGVAGGKLSGEKIEGRGRGLFKAKHHRLKGKIRITGNGGIYECAIPWGEISPSGSPPSSFSANIMINDLDKKSGLHSLSLAFKPTPFLSDSPLVSFVLKEKKEDAGEESPISLPGVIIHSRVDLVLLTISVTDMEDHYITDLTKNDFIIYDNGRAQEIALFEKTSRPITIALLIDGSGSMFEIMDKVKKAAVSFIDNAVRDEDQMLLIKFASEVKPLTDITSDEKDVKEMINGIEAYGGTALYDAIHHAISRLRFLRERKAIIVLTDGKDESFMGEGPGSLNSLDDVINLARTSNVIIYPIRLAPTDALAEAAMKRLAEETGGRFYSTHRIKKLAGIYSKIGEELRSQYQIGYYPKGSLIKGDWHSVKVELVPPGLRARTRTGYLSQK
jgi:Ca-activated chloride channel family protein